MVTMLAHVLELWPAVSLPLVVKGIVVASVMESLCDINLLLSLALTSSLYMANQTASNGRPNGVLKLQICLNLVTLHSSPDTIRHRMCH